MRGSVGWCIFEVMKSSASLVGTNICQRFKKKLNEYAVVAFLVHLATTSSTANFGSP